MKGLLKRIKLALLMLVMPADTVSKLLEAIKNEYHAAYFEDGEQFVIIHKQDGEFVAEPHNLTQEEFDNLLGYKAEWQDCK